MTPSGIEPATFRLVVPQPTAPPITLKISHEITHMRVDGKHWHINKDSCVITVYDQKDQNIGVHTHTHTHTHTYTVYIIYIYKHQQKAF
jgi:hypothetical protein